VSQVLEVSKGFPTDSPVFQMPERNQDNEKPRYVTATLSLIDAETANSRPWTKGGGIEVSNPCLRVTKNFIRKGRITPLLRDHHDFLTYDVARRYTGGNPFEAGYHPQPIPQGYVPPSLPSAAGELQPGFGALAVGGPSPYGSLVFRWAYPGEQIQAVLMGSENVTYTNVRRGIVEIESLAGHEYKPEQIGALYVDRTLWEIERAIFPAYPVLPILLDDIEKLLDDAEAHTSLRPIVDDYRRSLELFRDYAHLTIENVHAKMRETQGKHPYVQQDFVLLEQLGMERQDRHIRQTAKAQPNDRLEAMFEQWMAVQIEEKKANLDRLKRIEEVETPVINLDTMAAAPIVEAGYDGFPGASGYSGFSGAITNATSEGAEQIAVAMADVEPFVPVVGDVVGGYIGKDGKDVPTLWGCACGKSFDTPQGLSMHKRRHCELNKTE
jgi:hypothetical protein